MIQSILYWAADKVESFLSADFWSWDIDLDDLEDES
jgi:hypothetical protein